MKSLDDAYDASDEQIKALDDLWAGRVPKEFPSKKDKPKERVTTKVCPNCGDDKLLTFTSRNQKACVVCHTEFDWFLDEGQKPLF